MDVLMPEMDGFAACSAIRSLPGGILTASSGMAVYPEDGADLTSLIREADRAMYRAKQAGGNRIHFAAGQQA